MTKAKKPQPSKKAPAKKAKPKQVTPPQGERGLFMSSHDGIAVADAWLEAKRENPFLTKKDFARSKGIPDRTLAVYLSHVKEEETEIYSTYVAQCIEECAKENEVEATDVTWHQFRQWGAIAWGQGKLTQLSASITQLGGFNAIRDSFYPPNPTKFRVEKKVVQTHARFNRKLGDGLAQKSWMSESLEDFSQRVFAGKIAAPKLIPKKNTTKRVINTVWSDLHFGSDIKARETGAFQFGPVEEARRMAFIATEVANYKPQYRKDTELVIWLLGDIMQGQLHDARDGAASAEQMARSIHILTQAIAYESQAFGKVTVKCATGNHGRNKARHHERAVMEKWDSLETVIYYAIKSSVANLKNVSVEIPLTPYVTGSYFGVSTFGTHGDTVLKAGYPGSKVATGSILNQIDRMNQHSQDNAREKGLQHEPYHVYVCGHVHSPLVHPTMGGRALITNGALCPPDPYSVSLGSLAAPTGQWIWEQTEGFPLGDTRYVRVGFAQDQDASLDKIIQPWTDF